MALAGKNAIVFGVANKWSLAWAIARSWRVAGANVAIICASEKIASSVSKLAEKEFEDENTIEQTGNRGGVNVFKCDVTLDKDVSNTFSEVKSLFDGKLDTLLHSVAFAPGGILSKDYSSVSFEEYTITQNVTAFSLNRLCHEAKPMLIESGEGSVISMGVLVVRQLVVN